MPIYVRTHFSGGDIVKKLISLITMIVVGILLVSCSIGETQCIDGKTVEEVLNKGRNVSAILHKEELNNGVLVFYIPDIKGESKVVSQLGVDYIEKTFRGWRFSYKGGGFITGIEDLVHFESLPNDNDKDTPLPLFYGEIKSVDIRELLVIDLKNKEAKKEANIISIDRKPGIENDMRVWYVIIEEPENSNFMIKGIGANGEILFSKETNI